MIYLALPLHHLLSQWPSDQSPAPTDLPPFLLFFFKPQAKGKSSPCLLLAAWNHVDSPCCFLVLAHFDTRRSVLYAPLVGSIPGSLIRKKRAAPTVLDSVPFIPSPLLFLLLFFSSLISLFCSLAPVPTLLCCFWFNWGLIPILPLLFWCVSRSVAQRIGGGGVDASESHLSPWHGRAQSQREGWDFCALRPAFFFLLFVLVMLAQNGHSLRVVVVIVVISFI